MEKQETPKGKMNFASTLTMLDAERLQQSAKATVQSNGRLSLTVEAGRLMRLTDESSLIIFSAENGDLGAIVSFKNDKRAFELKKAGSYYYITFKQYLQEMGIDYKSQRIIYDITALDEEIEGKRLYRFARRILAKDSREFAAADSASIEDDTNEENASAEPAESPSSGASADTGEPSASSATESTHDAPAAPDESDNETAGNAADAAASLSANSATL